MLKEENIKASTENACASLNLQLNNFTNLYKLTEPAISLNYDDIDKPILIRNPIPPVQSKTNIYTRKTGCNSVRVSSLA